MTILFDDHKLTHILQFRIRTCVLVEGNDQRPQPEGQWWLHYSSSYPPGENFGIYLFMHHIYLDISIDLHCRFYNIDIYEQIHHSDRPADLKRKCIHFETIIAFPSNLKTVGFVTTYMKLLFSSAISCN